MTDPLAIAAPAPVLRVAGAVRPELTRDLARLRIAESVGGLRHLVAELVAFGRPARGGDDQLLHADRSLLDLGTEIEVSLGIPGSDRRVFTGVISELGVSYGNGTPPTVQICAEDQMMRLRMTRRRCTYEQMSDADIIGEIARQHGLRFSSELDGPVYDVVQQANQTDLAFARERAALVNGEVWLDDKTLHASDRGRRTGTRITLIQDVDLVGVTVRADLAHQRSEVAVYGYDAAAREAIEERAGDTAIRAEVTRGETGPALVSRAFGDTPTSTSADVPLTTQEARDWAASELRGRARRFVTACGTTRGTPDMVVGTLLHLVGVAPIFDGPGYYVTSFCHRYDTIDGFRTSFEAERPTLGARA